MRQFKVYRHPSEALESLRPGWSWPAFCFGSFWAFARTLWWPGALALGGLLVLHLLTDTAAPLGVATCCCHLVFGLRGQTWRIAHLLRQGYRHVDTVTASDQGGALALSIRQRGWRVSGPFNG